ncbi:MAG: phosphate ABC transporter permease PstA [Halonotius sp.]
MATDTDSGFESDSSLRWRKFKGRLFEILLFGSTLVGVVSLAVLFTVIGKDAFGPGAAEPAWYLLYSGTLVMPVSVYTLYVRRDPVSKAINAKAFVTVFGSLVGSLVVFALADAVSPHDVAINLVFATLFPAVVLAYSRWTGGNHLTGPALPVSVLVGLVVAQLLYGPIHSVLAILADWIIFLVIVTIPAAAIMGYAVSGRWSRRAEFVVPALVLAGALVTAGVALSQGIDPALWVVLVSGFVAPVGVVYADTLKQYSSGRIGLLGPAVLAGGILLGARIESQFGITGLDAWLTPTLLLNSWSSFRPEQAGIYPQLIGSILIIGVMALLAFPVGVGAAVYLEEYAPSTGWRGRLANALDVNISNLAGVPSVVYGLLGFALFQNFFGIAPWLPPALGLESSLLISASVTLGLLILPIVIVSSQEALRSVPDELREGSYGLGASRWQTIRNVVLPEAVPGILTGTILALGRAIGETAPLVMIGVAATSFSPPSGLFNSATALPLQIFRSSYNAIPAYRTGVVAAASFVLLVTMLVMNGTAILIRNRYENN